MNDRCPAEAPITNKTRGPTRPTRGAHGPHEGPPGPSEDPTAEGAPAQPKGNSQRPPGCCPSGGMGQIRAGGDDIQDARGQGLNGCLKSRRD